MGVATASSRHPDIGSLYKRISMNTEFAVKLHDTLEPGATLIVAGQPAERKSLRDVEFANK